jgi:hypothetical protein
LISVFLPRQHWLAIYVYIQGSDSDLKVAAFDAGGIAIAVAPKLMKAGKDVGFAFRQHPGVDEDFIESGLSGLLSVRLRIACLNSSEI